MSDVERLVVFAVLMETGKGIVTKSPGYIMEKFDAARSLPYPEKLLDSENTRKFERWKRTWQRGAT